MRHTSKLPGSAGCVAIVSVTLLAAATAPARADEVLDWNTLALRTTAAAPFDPPLESRNLAIVHAAIFDAINAITGDFTPYLARRAAGIRRASPRAAAVAAAHRALVRLYPGQQGDLDAAYVTSLAALPEEPGTTDGVRLGERVADELLSARASDGASVPAHGAPEGAAGAVLGGWVPTPPALLPALDPSWGKVRPFVLSSGAQLRPEPPPTLDSPEYQADFAEIKAIGAVRSAVRTQAETDLARLWIATGPQNWNPIARQVAAARGLVLTQNARLFALLNLAGADAFIVAWDAKFTFNQWRPVTAIRAAGSGGDASSETDARWTPLLVTPPFPDYIAGHTTYGGAAERVLERLLGKQPGVVMQLRSATAPGVVRTYTTFEAISKDLVEARIPGGIHWRTSSVRGRAVGQRLGDYAVEHIARVARRPGTVGLQSSARPRHDQ